MYIVIVVIETRFQTEATLIDFVIFVQAHPGHLATPPPAVAGLPVKVE
jgi:hypothetical protein